MKISPQKKAQCIEYALSHPEISVKQLAQDMGIGNSTLSKWLQEAKAIKHPNGERQLSPEQERIRQLEKENGYLREVNEVIKKAHQYFINNPCR